MSVATDNLSSALCSNAQKAGLLGWLCEQLQYSEAEFVSIEKLSGGAIQQNWLIEISSPDAKHENQKYVLRCDAPSQLGVSHQKSDEARVLQHLFAHGVLVPEIIGLCDEDDIIGKPFFVMRHISGEAQARKWVRHPKKNEFGDRLAFQLGQEMAKLHHIPQDAPEFAFISHPQKGAEGEALQEVRAILDRIDETHPVLEFGYRWLEERLDDWHDASPISLCHRDFRTGNFLIQDGQLTGLLDWEFARFSVPAEDIGWLCARCWRFGADTQIVGGLADFTAFEAGYKTILDKPFSRHSIRYWQIFAELRWAAIALEQAWRCHTGGEISLELALSAPLTAEMEYNLLSLISHFDHHPQTSLL